MDTLLVLTNLPDPAAALRALRKPCRVVVYSDAKYLVQGASLWIKGWQARGWQTRDGKPVANRDEWEALLEAARPHQVTWLLPQGEGSPADLDRAGIPMAVPVLEEKVLYLLDPIGASKRSAALRCDST